jgi:hypothetical protein
MDLVSRRTNCKWGWSKARKYSVKSAFISLFKERFACQLTLREEYRFRSEKDKWLTVMNRMADLDGDGLDDFCIVNPDSGAVEWYRNGNYDPVQKKWIW